MRNFIFNLGTYIDNIELFLLKLSNQIDLKTVDLTKLTTNLTQAMKDIINFLFNYLGSLIPQIATFTANIISSLFTTVIAFVVSVNLLAGKDMLMSQAKRVTYVYLPSKWARKIEHIAKLSADIFSKYVVGQLTEACILGVLCFIGMRLFGFNYAILISTLIAVTALIPMAGAYIGGGVAFILIGMISLSKAVLFIIYFCILQQLENSIIYPRVVGSSIGLPGLWVIFAVTIGGGFFGLAGIILSVPIMSIIYSLIRENVAKKECIKRAT